MPPVRPALWPYLCAFGFCLILSIVGIVSRPVFPVDETRYLTVAWEMFFRNDWILPTLNFEPYHHKPPLLFWLIMSVWSVTGVSQAAAMVVPYVIAFAATVALIRLTKVLLPDNSRLPLLAALLFLGSLPFTLYSHLIMFDMLLTVFVITGITALWQFAQTGRWVYILALGASIGLGVLAKGPVVLLHMLCPAVLAALWIQRGSIRWSKWIGALVAAILIGAAIGLSWAIPAAMRGGPEFTEKIFWGQTANRMTSSFDHARPVWWYLPILPIFITPWLLHAGVWKGLRLMRRDALPSAVKYLLCWIVPAIACFSLISGKQIHYLLPLVPGIIILLALALDRARDIVKPAHAVPALAVASVLTLLPALIKPFARVIETNIENTVHLADSLERMSMSLSIVCTLIVILGGLVLMRRGLTAQIGGVTLAMLVFVSCVQLEARAGYFRNYDLTPIAAIVRDYPDVPLAFVRNYHGEWGFLAQLEHPVKQLEPQHLDAWFADHPNGIAFMRTRRPEEFAAYDAIFTMPYKMTNTYAVIIRPGTAGNFNPPLMPLPK